MPRTPNNAPFTSETGRVAASKPRLPEPTVKMQVVLYERQQAELARLGINRSELLRRLLDEYLTGLNDRG